MDPLILASEECDIAREVVCVPANVLDLFEFNSVPIFIGLGAVIIALVMYFALRKPKLVPGKFQASVESLISLVSDSIARDVIGPEGVKYVPYLLSLFFFIWVGNLMELVPGINFPFTSRMAIPLTLALLTWVIFVVEGIRKQGLHFFLDLIWPPGVPVALKPLVGLIEFVSTLIVRPFSLTVRLFANLVAGHVMLALLLGSAGFFLLGVLGGDISVLRGSIGAAWFVVGVAIFMFEVLVGFLQAYIFTLLSAVYIESSLHPQH